MAACACARRRAPGSGSACWRIVRARRTLARVAISYVLDRDARLIRATVRGDFSVDDMLACVEGAADEAGEPGYNILSDHRLVGEPATRPQLEALVTHLRRLQHFFAGARWAIVATSPASFGMMRMLEVLAERVPMAVRVFTGMAGAEQWARTGVLPPGPSAPPPPHAPEAPDA